MVTESEALVVVDPPPFVLKLPQPVDESQLIAIAQENPGYRFETTADGRLVVSFLTGTFANGGEVELIRQLGNWNVARQGGRILSSSGGFTLANGAIAGPDGAFVSHERLATLDPERDDRAFERIAPEAVFEVLSPSDNRRYTDEKCRAYVATGSDVAVLINPRDRSVTLYRAGREPAVVPDATLVTIGDELPGFTLDAAAIFAAGKRP